LRSKRRPFRVCPQPSTRLARLLAISSGEAQTLIASAIEVGESDSIEIRASEWKNRVAEGPKVDGGKFNVELGATDLGGLAPIVTGECRRSW
jgi:hypothetical protein